MLAYVLYSKDLGLVMKALDKLRDVNLKFDVDLDKGNIYINEAEAAGPECSTLLESLIVPRRCFLRTVSATVGQDGKITYGPEGSGISTGTQGLLERIRNTTNVEVMERCLIYYTRRKAFWVTGEGFFKVDLFKKDLELSSSKYSKRILQYWNILKKLVTLD